jgi:hypothetical protein
MKTIVATLRGRLLVLPDILNMDKSPNQNFGPGGTRAETVGGDLKRFNNYCGLTTARNGFPWEKTT